MEVRSGSTRSRRWGETVNDNGDDITGQQPYPIDVTVQQADFSFTARTPGGGQPNHEWYFADADSAKLFAASAHTPSGIVRGLFDGGQYYVGALLTIQAAVNAVAAGGTVNVAPGTYQEQLDIGKDVALQGAGTGLTVIESPLALAASFGDKKAVVFIHDTGNASLQGLTVDGAGRGNGNARFIGIAFDNAGGSVDGVEIKGMRETPLSGSQSGIGIYALNESGTARFVSVKNSNVYDYQKGGIVLNGANTAGIVGGNTVTGVGPTPLIAQNGIQVGFGATAQVIGNAVSDNVWTGTYGGSNDPLSDPDADGSSGILLYMPGAGIMLGDNVLTTNQFGVWTVAAPDVIILHNVITGLTHTGNAFPVGIAIWSADQWTIPLSGTEAGTVGSIQGNTMSGHDYGLQVRDFTQGGAVPSVEVHLNAITENEVFAAWSSAALDATGNWWGSATGPGGQPVPWNVTIQPWLTRLPSQVILSNESYLGFGYQLNAGWEIFSIPVWAENATLFGTLENLQTDNEGNPDAGGGVAVPRLSGLLEEAKVEVAYRFNAETQAWEQVLNGDALAPFEAVYVKSNEAHAASLNVTPDLTSPPAAQLQAGWNLVGMALDPLGPGTMAAPEAFVSAYNAPGGTGYVQIFSPALNPVPFAWARDSVQDPIPVVEIRRGYWVFMENPDTIAGFSSTPLPLP